MLLGDSGTGKTHPLIALAIAADQGRRARYHTTAALVYELTEIADDKQLTRVVNRYARLDLLCLDVNRPASRGELSVCPGALLAHWGCVEPGVVGRALDLDELAQSLHLEGGGVVGDELEATHQRVSPAKYLAARWRISRSTVNFVVST